jgi:hypothetical protein
MKQKVITREEVRVTRRGMIATLPKRACRAGKHKAYGYTIYLPIERLWLPLVRKLNVEMPAPWGSEALNCVMCGKKFFVAWRKHFSGHYLHPVCSDGCAGERRNIARRRWRREHAEQRRKEISHQTCPHCGGAVHGNRNTKRYCSVRCRVAAHRCSR